MISITDYTDEQVKLCVKNDQIDKNLYQEYGVKRGLRDEQGQGVLTGLTNISQITAFKNVNGEKIPCDGELLYRGYNVRDLVNGAADKRFILRREFTFFYSEICLIMNNWQSSGKHLTTVWISLPTLQGMSL